MNLVPLASVPIEVRKEYALALRKLDLLDGWEALVVTVDPDDVLVPEFAENEFLAVGRPGQPRERNCISCGRICWSRGQDARCWDCYNKDRRSTRGFCSHGHPWTPENIYTRANGHQYCRPCMNNAKRAHRERYGRRDRAKT